MSKIHQLLLQEKKTSEDGCIDLTSCSDSDEPIIISIDENGGCDDNMLIKRHNEDYSDITSAEDCAVTVESVEEGELTPFQELRNSEIVNKQTVERECTLMVSENSLTDISTDKTKHSILKNLLVTIQRTDINQNIQTKESPAHDVKITKQKKHRNRRKSKQLKRKERGDHSKDKVKSTEHCQCCKCVKMKALSNIYKRNAKPKTSKKTNKEQPDKRAQSAREQIRNDFATKKKKKIESPLKRLVSEDRPIPQCLRKCHHNKINYSLQVKNQRIDKKTRRCLEDRSKLEFISSDDFNISDDDFESSFSISDIENLISRTKTRIQNPTNSFQTGLESILISPCDKDIQDGRNIHKHFVGEQDVYNALSPITSSDFDIPESCPVTPVLVIDSDVKLKENIQEEKAPHIEAPAKSFTYGNLKLVPIEKLMEKEPKKVTKIRNYSSVHNSNPVSVPTPLKVKPIGTVKPIFKTNEHNIYAGKKVHPDPNLESKRKKLTIPKNPEEIQIQQIKSNTEREETNGNPKELPVTVGTILNARYNICEIVKRGSYSNVVRAIDKQNGDNIILKILHQNKYNYVLRNLNLLKGINPMDKFHCVRLNGQFYANSHLVLWLESYSGNLRERLNEQESGAGLPFVTVQLLSRQLLLGVQLLREHNILHGDIKPEHILINSSNTTLKLTGLDGAQLIQKNMATIPCLGPMNYRAPEIILNLEFDYSVDVWSAACVTYEMAAGRQLFSATTENEALWQIMQINGKFPKQMTVGKHFNEKGNFVREHVNVKTRKTASVGEVPSSGRRDLRAELARARDARCGEPGPSAEATRLIHLLNTALHTMLLVEPNRRVSVDFALLNQFFCDS